MSLKKLLFLLPGFFVSLLLQAQQPLVTLKNNNISMSGVIDEIEKSSGYTFLYSDSQIRTIRHLNVNFYRTEVNKVLDYCLRNTGLTYQMEEETIIIVPLDIKNKSDKGADIKNIEKQELYFGIEGEIKDKFGNLLPGVNVYVKNSPGRGVASDMNGHYRISVRLGDVLVFSFISYKTKEVFINKVRSRLEVELDVNPEKIDEVQVIGYGTQRKISVVGAISNMQVKGRNFPVTSFSNMISGAVSGIIGVQRNGEPGQDISEFWIRGLSTFGAKDKALVLIDGVERNSFNDLIPEDIESFSVLKDAAVTSVYGAKGASGVLLITTRRGREGRMQIRASGKTMLSCLPRLPQYLNAYDYARLSNEARIVRGMDPLYNEAQFHIIRKGLDPDLYPNINWQEELLRKWCVGSQFNVSCDGGGNITRYYISGNYRTNDAVYKESSSNDYHTNVRRRQYAFRMNLDMNVTPSTLVMVNFATNLVNLNRPGIGITDKIWKAQAELNPLAVPVRYSGGQFPCYGTLNEASPEVLLNETGYISEFKNNTEMKLEVRQDLSRFISGWNLGMTVAYDVCGEQVNTRTKYPDLYRATGRDAQGNLMLQHRVSQRGMTFESNSTLARRFYFEGRTNYQQTFKGHSLSGLLLYNLSEYTSSEVEDPLYAVPERYMGAAGRLAWSFEDVWFAEFDFGYNGSANFPKGKRFGFFPSGAVGCIFSNLSWFRQKASWLDFFKIRYSFGLVGNDEVSGLRFPYVSYVDVNVPGYSFGNYGDNTWGGIAESVVGSNNLTWEKAYKHDLGVELGVGHFFFEIDFFRDVRKGIFMQRMNLPNTAGFPSKPYGNVGRMRNRGYEGTLTYKDSKNDWGWEIRGNFTYSENKVLEYDEPYQPYNYMYQKGKSLDAARGLIALGYFRDSMEILSSQKHMDNVRPGDIKYKDVNGDGVIDDSDIVPIGNSSIPRLQYGLAGNLKWKAWDLGIFLRGSGAVAYFYGGNSYFPFLYGETGNVLNIVNEPGNRWVPAWYSGDSRTENPDARFPRLSYGSNKNNYRPSTHWLADGRYLRLKTLELGYSFPAFLLHKLNLTTLRVSVMGDNLYVWDKIRLWDPEQASSNGAVYPLTRSVVFNVQIIL